LVTTVTDDTAMAAVPDALHTAGRPRRQELLEK
jgi:hypothetical protein